MISSELSNPLYDISNRHFRVKITGKNSQVIAGQFVQFKVVNQGLEQIYPAEKYCFIPDHARKEFWKSYHDNNGEFKTFPKDVIQLGMNEIKRIVIEPELVY